MIVMNFFPSLYEFNSGEVIQLIDTLKLSESVKDYVIRVRRHLHENPELSMQEVETIKFVCHELEEMNIPYEIVPDGGVIGTIKGSRNGKTLVLRADLDALPMQEATTNLVTKKSVISNVDGVAHTCGHDAHTAMLLGVSKLLMEQRAHFTGTILLVFEQGEEIGGGIVNMMNRLTEIGADGVWGIHLKNDLPSGKISVEAGPRMSAPLPFEILLKGEGGHGSRPDLANSPIDCFVDFYNRLTTMRMQRLNPHKPVTFSIGAVHAGKAANVIPESLTFSGTFRFLHKDQGDQIVSNFNELLEDTCRTYHCTYEYIREPVAKDLLVYNNDFCSEIAERAVEKSIGKSALQRFPAWMASEPFALYQAFFPGVFAFLGIENEAKGTGADHHNVHFDVDEDVLRLGVAATLQYTIDFLENNEPIPFEKKHNSVEELMI